MGEKWSNPLGPTTIENENKIKTDVCIYCLFFWPKNQRWPMRPATKHTNQRFDLFEKGEFSKMSDRLTHRDKKKTPKKLVIFIYLIN